MVPTGSPDPVCEDGYQQTYNNYTTVADSGVYKGQLVGATVISDGYLTYGLADTAEDCLPVCDSVAGCVFVATYLDNEEDDTQEPRHSGKYTCALYSQCVGTDKATNFGGVSSCHVMRTLRDDPETDVVLLPNLSNKIPTGFLIPVVGARTELATDRPHNSNLLPLASCSVCVSATRLVELASTRSHDILSLILCSIVQSIVESHHLVQCPSFRGRTCKAG